MSSCSQNTPYIPVPHLPAWPGYLQRVFKAVAQVQRSPERQITHLRSVGTLRALLLRWHSTPGVPAIPNDDEDVHDVRNMCGSGARRVLGRGHMIEAVWHLQRGRDLQTMSRSQEWWLGMVLYGVEVF